ncbi:hypothetical protein CFR80_09610 [Komagataeibacter oboediens]|nr:hypothetical protein CFR80_09610 [Komagataeibacter oboediens]
MAMTGQGVEAAGGTGEEAGAVMIAWGMPDQGPDARQVSEAEGQIGHVIGATASPRMVKRGRGHETRQGLPP